MECVVRPLHVQAVVLEQESSPGTSLVNAALVFGGCQDVLLSPMCSAVRLTLLFPSTVRLYISAIIALVQMNVKPTRFLPIYSLAYGYHAA